MTAEQTSRQNYLKNWVISRCDELTKGLDSFTPESDITNPPVGFIEEELDNAARYVLRMADRSNIFYATKKGTVGAEIAVIQDSGLNAAIIPLPLDFLRFVRLKLSTWQFPVSHYVSDTSHTYRRQQFEQSRGTVERPVVSLIPYHESYTAATIVSGAITAINTAGGVTTITDTNADFTNVKVGDVIKFTSGTQANLTRTVLSKSGTTIITVDTGAAEPLVADTYAISSVITPPIKQALHCFPYNASIAEFIYVPFLKSYDMPEELEDALVWKTAQNVLLIMRQVEVANAAGGKFAEVLQELNFGMKGEHSGDVSHGRK